MSDHETPMSPDVMHTPDATKEVSLKTTNQTLKNIKIWCVSKGALPPVTPISPYLGGGHKKIGYFSHAKPYFCLSETLFLG